MKQPATTSSLVMVPEGDDSVNYPGSKNVTGLAQWICDRLPSHVYYAEPFAGKVAIFRNKVPALRSWLIDQDLSVIAWLRRRYQLAGGDDVRSILFELDEAGSRRQPRRIRRADPEVMHGCGIRFCELAAEWQIPDLLIYCDPPYLPATRTKKRIYNHELSEADHVRFLQAVNAISGPVVISGYWSRLYAEWLSGWRLDTREVMTRGGTMRTECVWRNEAAVDRHSTSVSREYSDLGECWRDRDRVSKKVRRWVANYSEMPKRERQAILLALLDAERIQSRRK